MIYLTEARLTGRARRITRDAYAVHQMLTGALNARPVHWALPTPTLLIVQAAQPIRPSDLPGLTEFVASRPKPVDFADGAEVHLAGIVNAASHHWRSDATGARIIGPDGRGRQTRRALPPERWHEWGERKLSGAIHIHNLDMSDHGAHHGARPGTGRFTHKLVSMSATGTVRDPDALRRILTDGIGPGKAFGAGLILCRAADGQEITS